MARCWTLRHSPAMRVRVGHRLEVLRAFDRVLSERTLAAMREAASRAAHPTAFSDRSHRPATSTGPLSKR